MTAPKPNDFKFGEEITDEERKAAMFRLVDAEVIRFREDEFKKAFKTWQFNEARSGR